MPTTETLYHVTLLSNFVRAYDKYSRTYDKSKLPKSTYPDQFFLLRESEIHIGIHKAEKLLERIGAPGDCCIALQTIVQSTALHDNTRTGLGRYVIGGEIVIAGVAWLREGHMAPIAVEEAIAEGFRAARSTMHSYDALQPRSFSVLPIARGCQAACSFCFSKASISSVQRQASLGLEQVREMAVMASQRGANRFVITGGGEPGLVKHERLCSLMEAGSTALGKTILITNGHHLATAPTTELRQILRDYYSAGLRVLSISRHHHDCDANEAIMKLRTDVAGIARSWLSERTAWPDLKLRLVCVVQRGGIDTLSKLEDYIGWATKLGIAEICFKELYVSTSSESVYHQAAANQWSYAHQVPLSLVLEFAERHEFSLVERLPWGAPVLRGTWEGKPMQIAAYTEPSLYWERSNKVARSWNQLADGRCFVSLEDRASEIAMEQNELR